MNGRLKKGIVSKALLVAFVFLVISLSNTLSLLDFRNVFAVTTPFSGGDGSVANPYVVNSAEDLDNVRYYRTSHFVQSNHIDFGGSEFAPIGHTSFPFTGSYDGGQYLISNLRINSVGNDMVGLFSFNGGTIRGVNLLNATISGDNNVGGIAGLNIGTIEKSRVNATITGVTDVGGIVGVNQGVVRDSSNIGNVTATKYYVGGIAGINYGEINDTYNLGKITGGTYVGGISGSNNNLNNRAKITNSYNYSVEQNLYGKTRGQIAGENTKGQQSWGYIDSVAWLNNDPNISASFGATILETDINDSEQDGVYNSDVTIKTDNIVTNAQSLEQVDFTQVKTFEQWDGFENSWQFLTNATYPTLLSEYVAVTSIVFGTNSSLDESNSTKSIELQAGEQYPLTATVLPIHSTIRHARFEVVENDDATDNAKLVGSKNNQSTNNDNKLIKNNTTKSNSTSNQLASIDDKNILTINENTPVGTTIKVKASAENIEEILTITTVAIPVGSIQIVVKEDKKELAFGDTLHLSAVVYPNNASFQDVTWRVNVDFASITSDGYLALTSNAAIGSKFVVYATSVDDSNIFARQEFAVVRKDVDGVYIVSGNQMRVGDHLPLIAEVVPNNATDNNVIFSIVNDTTNSAEIVDNSYLTAQQEGQVTIKATADGMSSDDFVISVGKILPTSIVFENVETFKHTTSLQLVASLRPLDAEYANISFRIVSDTANSSISNNILTSKQPGVVIVRAEILVESKTIWAEQTITVQKEPVTSISFTNAKSFRYDNKLQLSATAYPTNATYRQITFEIDNTSSNTANASLSSSNLLSATKDGQVTILAKADGVTQKMTIKVEPILVIGITLLTNTNQNNIDWQYNERVELKQGQSIEYKVELQSASTTHEPSNKTTHMYYSLTQSGTKIDIQASNDYFAHSGNVITVKKTAPIFESIWIHAVSDDGGYQSSMQIVVAFVYADDFVNQSTLDSSGWFQLGNMGTSLNVPGVSLSGYDITIKNNTNTLIQRTLTSTSINNATSFYILLYRNTSTTLQATYSVNIKVLLRTTNNTEFSIDIPFNNYNVVSKTLPSQISDYNAKRDISSNSNRVALVVFDGYYANSTTINSNILINNFTQGVYINANPNAQLSNLDFAINNGSTNVDLYLNGLNFGARDNQHAINSTGSGVLSLHILNTTTVRGGNGSGYTSDGKAGATGKDGISANKVEIYGSKSISIIGGQGGQGSIGTKGNDGDRGSDASGLGAGSGGKGKDGETGGQGNVGGIGGYAINISNLVIYSTNISLIGGTGGQGGTGGTGGNGGQGGNGKVSLIGTGKGNAGAGGHGGVGGKGGVGGDGGFAISSSTNIANISGAIVNQSKGSQGVGGTGGNGGDGNTGGSSVNGSAGAGGNGGSGGSGGEGSRIGNQGNRGWHCVYIGSWDGLHHYEYR
jgi:hypothetical protein